MPTRFFQSGTAAEGYDGQLVAEATEPGHAAREAQPQAPLPAPLAAALERNHRENISCGCCLTVGYTSQELEGHLALIAAASGHAIAIRIEAFAIAKYRSIDRLYLFL